MEEDTITVVGYVGTDTIHPNGLQSAIKQRVRDVLSDVGALFGDSLSLFALRKIAYTPGRFLTYRP